MRVTIRSGVDNTAERTVRPDEEVIPDFVAAFGGTRGTARHQRVAAFVDVFEL